MDPGGASPAPVEAPATTLTLRLRSSQGVIARSVEGPASGQLLSTQTGLRHTLLDLRDAPAPHLRLLSSRDLQALASSASQAGNLAGTSAHQALLASTILGGEAQGSYLLAAQDRLDLALAGPALGPLGEEQAQPLAMAWSDRLAALASSRLEDSGGGDAVAIEALLEASLAIPAGAALPRGELVLEATALLDSTVLLGEEGSQVVITSRLTLSGWPPPTLAAAGGLQVRGAAVGLAHSLLQTGAGDDILTIRASLEGPDGLGSGGNGPGVELEALALDQATIRLGDGHDQLMLAGTVRDSRIETGGGTTRLRIDGAIEASSLVLRPGAQVEGELGEQSSDLALLGAGEITLSAGAGDDHLRLGPGIAGWIDGGEGLDRLSETGLAPRAAAESPLLRLEGPGAGMLGAVRFEQIEAVAMATPATRVWVGQQGSLAEGLRTGAGSRLDYSSWGEAVGVDLRQGRATAFAQGRPGAVEGVGEILGGGGADQLVAGWNGQRLEGGAGDDWLELGPWGGAAQQPGTVLVGGSGNDLFVLPRLESRALAMGGARGLPTLLDLSLLPQPSDGSPLPLSDRIAWWQPSALVAEGGPDQLVVLQPRGLEGIGDPRLLPIAPLAQLLAGMAGHGPQLAIAADPGGSELVLLESSSSSLPLAHLPALRLAARAPGSAGSEGMG